MSLRGAGRGLVGAAAVTALVAAAVTAWRWPTGLALRPAALTAAWGRPVMVGWVLLAVALVAIEWRLVVALTRSRLPRPGRQTGTAVIEFALLFPIAVMVLMIIVQLALLMHGNVMINYAAYAATRAAVVQIPRDLSGWGEGRNELIDDPAAPKMRRIHRAAVLAVTPISGRLPASREAEMIQEDLRLLYAQAGATPRAGLNVAFAEKFTYADQRTRIMDVGRRNNAGGFDPLQAVRVVIQHDLELSVPFARAIFANGQFTDSRGEVHYYTTVEAYYQLTNEGPRPEPLEPYCPVPPPPPGGGTWSPPPTGCPLHQLP